MNRAKFEANELRMQIFADAHFQCVHCGKMVTQLAHKIPATKVNLKAYGKEVIHHRLNLDAVCGLRCNAKSLIGQDMRAESRLVKQIMTAIENNV